MYKKQFQQDKRARIKLRLKERSWVKLRRAALAVIMTTVMAVPAAALALEVEIPYQQTFTNDSATQSVADTFNYQMTANDSSTPMPSGSVDGAYSFNLKGNAKGSLKLDIPFTKPGYYYYTVKSVDPPQTGYTYATTYTVMIMITNSSDGLANTAITIQDPALSKYDSLVFTTKYYKARPGNNDNDGGGTGGGAGGGAAAGAAGTAGAANPGPGDTGNPPTTIDDPEPPLAGVDKGDDYWALINLICMILTWLTAIIALACYIKRRNDYEKAEDANEEALMSGGELEETEDIQKLKRKGIVRILNIAVAIIALIVFILTEDMTLPMELVDEWTIWMIVILAVALLLALISRKVAEEPDELELEQ